MIDLHRTHSARWKEGPPIKFKLDCKARITADQPTTSDWLVIESLLATTGGETGILKGILDKTKSVVAKFGVGAHMSKDYEAAKALSVEEVPNCIKYMCFFTCNDTTANLLRQNYGHRAYICNGPGDGVGCIVMPYYSIGSMDAYPWRLATLPVLKACLCQLAGAMLTAFQSIGFVHNDVHLGNVLLRKTKKKELVYGEAQVATENMYPILMDFERSTLGAKDPTPVYHNIRKLLHLACTSDASDLSLAFDEREINACISAGRPVDHEAYTIAWRAVASMRILYEKSKRPPNPFA